MMSEPFVVGSRDGLEGLLAGLKSQQKYCVPDLDFDGEVVYDGVLGPELDSEGGLMVSLEPVLREAQQQTRFPDTYAV